MILQAPHDQLGHSPLPTSPRLPSPRVFIINILGTSLCSQMYLHLTPNKSIAQNERRTNLKSRRSSNSKMIINAWWMKHSKPLLETCSAPATFTNIEPDHHIHRCVLFPSLSWIFPCHNTSWLTAPYRNVPTPRNDCESREYKVHPTVICKTSYL